MLSNQETSMSSEKSSEEDHLDYSADSSPPDIQTLILAELKEVNKRLDKVESKVEHSKVAPCKKKDIKNLSKVSDSKKFDKKSEKIACSVSSSEEESITSISQLKKCKKNHEAILGGGGPSRQRITFDQISLT